MAAQAQEALAAAFFILFTAEQSHFLGLLVQVVLLEQILEQVVEQVAQHCNMQQDLHATATRVALLLLVAAALAAQVCSLLCTSDDLRIH